MQSAKRDGRVLVSGGRKQYYSERSGKDVGEPRIDLPTLLKMFQTLYAHFDSEGYFQQALGFTCVDSDYVPGTIGFDVEHAVILAIRRQGLTPIYTKAPEYSIEDLFDVIEFLYEHCSKPVTRNWHDWNGCGWHCTAFDKDVGRDELREKLNRILNVFDRGYELSAEGEVLVAGDTGMHPLLVAELPRTTDQSNVTARVATAVHKFRRRNATLTDRSDAVRDLADVLEYLRPLIKRRLVSKDEQDLFNLANNFGIRHHNDKQRTNYDKGIWCSWMFYHYLSTIQAVLRLRDREHDSDRSVKV